MSAVALLPLDLFESRPSSTTCNAGFVISSPSLLSLILLKLDKKLAGRMSTLLNLKYF